MSQSQKTYRDLLEEAKARGIEYLCAAEMKKSMQAAMWDEKTIEMFFKHNHYRGAILVNGRALCLLVAEAA